MGKQEDVAAARGLVRTLDKAVAALVRHYPEGVDVQRLRADTSRLDADLDLLCGAQTVSEASPPVLTPPRMIIADTPYTHDFWMDAEDEGLGGRTEHGRR